jgi:hypothetical protein
MGCGCGGSVNTWTPMTDAQAADGAESVDPNERIQQAQHERAAARVWPGTWDGVRQPETTKP